MNSNQPQENKHIAPVLPPVFNRYPYSDADAECNRILAWYETHLILTVEDCIYELKIAYPDKRIASLRKKGHKILTKREEVHTTCGHLKTTTVYILHRKLKPMCNSFPDLKILIERLPGFETLDIDSMTMDEQVRLYFLLNRL
ncbi:helix-turn-helix domain-containing protein [Noviherbaspirillum autotrophicum]|uniref:Winged helix-turn-helix domain-containing protein n=1 Tax=Noviherbaspirillum autotrophicum TaxID=709839 RepID=A0A0C2BQZ1_9BURK|nr:helix-turn-helix domain-containing protein [Noviherbaspirillum autotrophicum]KIF82484.1 hypothetical protein TSA66_19355 [Noviherbaspirillum autotrophicum]